VGQNVAAGLSPPREQVGDKNRVLMALKRGDFADLIKIQGESVRLCWTGNRLESESQ
jgi:hypothetical protein